MKLEKYGEALLIFRSAVNYRRENAEAIEHFDAAIRKAQTINDPALDEILCKALITKGRYLVIDGKFNEALSVYREAEKVNPDNAVVHFNIGYALDRLDKKEDALVRWQRAVEIDPEYIDAYYFIGMHYGLMNDYDNAIRNYTKCTEIRPDSWTGWSRLAIMYKFKKDYGNVIACAQKAINCMHSGDILTVHIKIADRDYYNLAEAYHKIGETVQALDVIKTALDMGADHSGLFTLYRDITGENYKGKE